MASKSITLGTERLWAKTPLTCMLTQPVYLQNQLEMELSGNKYTYQGASLAVSACC